jgi:hypothetical protein
VSPALAHTDKEFGVFLLRRTAARRRAVCEGAAPQRLFAEAESALLPDGIEVVSEPDSGLAYLAGSGVVNYDLLLPDGGDYFLWLKVKKIGTGEGQLPVSTTGSDPDISDEFTGDGDGQWQWRAITGREGSPQPQLIPRLFNLCPGWNRVTVQMSSSQGLALESLLLTSDLKRSAQEQLADGRSGASRSTTGYPRHGRPY